MKFKMVVLLLCCTYLASGRAIVVPVGQVCGGGRDLVENTGLTAEISSSATDPDIPVAGG